LVDLPYNLDKVNHAFTKELQLDLSEDLASSRLQPGQAVTAAAQRTSPEELGLIVYLIPPSGGKPTFVVAAHDDGVDLATTEDDTIGQLRGDITVKSGNNRVVQTRIALVDSLSPGGNSTVWFWHKTDAKQSVGSDLIDAGDPQCPSSGAACSGAKPSNWAKDFTNDDRTFLTADKLRYLAFTAPYVKRGNVYEYWLRAFDTIAGAHDIDPKIINKP
jgi:hypothetical protein